MSKIILANSQAIFRAGTAKVLAMEEDFRVVAQCADVERMMHAITAFPGAIVLCASILHPDMEPLQMKLECSGNLLNGVQSAKPVPEMNVGF